MKPSPKKSEDQKSKIKSQLAELSRLLSMVPSGDTIKIHDQMTQKEIELSDWLSSTRNSFLNLSLLIRSELDIGVH